MIRSLCSLAILACALFAQSTNAQTTPATPNVLLICLDDLGFEKLDSYGVTANPYPTPNLNALAAQGVRFENAWAAPLCTPTRACILSGRFGRRTGVGHLVPTFGLADSEVTIAEHLDSANSGYGTAAVGKWHASLPQAGASAPNDQGFDHFAGYVFGLSDYYAWFRTVDGVTDTSLEYAPSQMIDDALAWIGTQEATDTPWFCYLAPVSIHTPFQAPPAHLHTEDLPGLDPDVDQEAFARAMAEAIDNEIQRMLTALGTSLDETVVILTSDNGSEQDLLEPQFNPLGGKGSPFESGVRVPLIVSGPIVDNPGRVVTQPVHVVDLFATVAELCGVPVPQGQPEFDSQSLIPVLEDETATLARTIIYTEAFTPIRELLPCDFRAARTERFKLVRFYCPGELVQESFYDLLSDPNEFNDLLSSATPLTLEESEARTSLSDYIDQLTDIGNGLSTFGATNCVGSNGTLELFGAGNPVLGDAFVLLVENGAPLTPVTLMFSVPSIAPGTVPLPLDLEPLGTGPDCFLQIEPMTNLVVVANAGGRAGLRFEVPNLMSLLGLTVDSQAILLDAGLVGSVSLPLVTSNVVRAIY
ncbi:MAG: sulfatase-like hydrolase/transferase [Planctomycetota bacterium]